jgi:hypothetical protein
MAGEQHATAVRSGKQACNKLGRSAETERDVPLFRTELVSCDRIIWPKSSDDHGSRLVEPLTTPGGIDNSSESSYGLPKMSVHHAPNSFERGVG